VTREELRQRLWPNGTFVDFDHGLNAVVNRLRDTLGDSADRPRFIETVPRRGYRFVGGSRRLAGSGRDRLFGRLEKFELDQPPTNLTVSPDGKTILYLGLTRKRDDLMMIENFR
jgi:DNA-binding winged helix-turn-helix (wHTH) protein